MTKHDKPAIDNPAGHAVENDERDLFRAAVGHVSRIDKNHRQTYRPLPSPRPRMREADEAAVMDELLDVAPPDPDIAAGDELIYRRHGVQLSVLRRLRRGHYRCQAEIDLHGMFVRVAYPCLNDFLRDCQDRNYRCIRVIHGKGLRSGNRGPILKGKVAGWLRRREDVLAFCSARRLDGGTGALYVLLRRM